MHRGWDLGNEVNNIKPENPGNEDDFYVWCASISDAIRVCDPERPVISGMCSTNIEKEYDSLMVIRDTCDIHTCHPYNIFHTHHDPLPTMKPVLDLSFRCQLGNDIARVPTFVQEFGFIGYVNCSQKTEADFYRACLYTALSYLWQKA